MLRNIPNIHIYNEVIYMLLILLYIYSYYAIYLFTTITQQSSYTVSQSLLLPIFLLFNYIWLFNSGCQLINKKMIHIGLIIIGSSKFNKKFTWF